MLSKLKENFFLRSFFYNVLKHKDTSRKVNGYNKRLYFNAGTNLNLFFQRKALIEADISNNLKILLQPDFIVYDIGANIGYYTVLFSQIATKGKIIAFEPDKFNFKYLLKNKELNNLENVILVDKGVSSVDGDSVFYQDINTGRTSSLEKNAWHPNAAKIKTEKIEKITLDNASKIYGRPNLIKCDVEGHEVEVLRGADKVLSNKPILMLEVIESNRIMVTELLKKYHYIFFNAELPFNFDMQSTPSIQFPNVLCINEESLSKYRLSIQAKKE